MADMSPGAALRLLEQAQAGLRKARQSLRLVRGEPANDPVVAEVLRAGWHSLAEAHRLLGTIPLAAASEPVMTRQLAVERYATALLVRLRRLMRSDAAGDDEEVDLDQDRPS